MSNFTLSIQAEWDLAEIWAYIADDNPVAATDMLERLYARFEKLASFPKMGSVPNELQAELVEEIYFFAVPDTDYLIFYSIQDNNSIEIVRVFHSSLDYIRVLRD